MFESSISVPSSAKEAGSELIFLSKMAKQEATIVASASDTRYKNNTGYNMDTTSEVEMFLTSFSLDFPGWTQH